MFAIFFLSPAVTAFYIFGTLNRKPVRQIRPKKGQRSDLRAAMLVRLGRHRAAVAVRF